MGLPYDKVINFQAIRLGQASLHPRFDNIGPKEGRITASRPYRKGF